MRERGVPWLRRVYSEVRLLAHALRHGLWRSLARGPGRAALAQQVLTWPTALPAGRDAAEIVAALRAFGLHVREGGNAFYLPPQRDLAQVLGPVVDRYPPASGFKVLRDFRGLDEAHYLRPERQTRLRRRLIGTPRDQLVTANYLHRLGLGPRVWDLCLLRAGPLTMPAFVVEHVNGDTPTAEEYGAFQRRLHAALAGTELRITLPHWQRNKDFRCPGCNGNLLRDSSGGLQYIDFQNFSVRNPQRLLAGPAEAGEPYAAEGLGRAGGGGCASERFAAVRRLLRAHGLDVADRLVIDVGCGAGALLHHALAAGAWWALGFDQPPAIRRAAASAAALGFTRLDVVAASPGPGGDLGAAVPGWLNRHRRESVVVVRGAPHSADTPASLAAMPWRAIVYEGQARGGRSDDGQRRARDLSLILRPSVAGAVR